MRLLLALGLLAGCSTVRADTGAAEEGFKLIRVADLEALRASGRPLSVYDANGARIREKEGIIPGAKLLSSFSEYDLAKELPADKGTALVFYCHNVH